MDQLSALQSPLHWYDGMLLLPEHFRYGFARGEALLHYRLMAVHPYCWGVRQYRFNPAALSTGVAELVQLEAVFPDGAVVSYDAVQSSEPLRIDLRAAAEQLRERPRRIWITLAASGEEELQAGYRRYRLGEAEVLTYGEQQQERSQVLVLEPHLQLVLDDVLPARLVGIPLAEVAWEHEAPTLTPYVPPLLHVEVASPVGQMVQQIVERLREKAQQLVNRINNPQPGISELVIDEFKFYVASLTGELPLLETLLASNRAHPWTLFAVLAQIAGRVAALGSERIPPIFSPYQHDQLYASFDQLRRYILRMVAESALETYIRVPFQLEGTAYKVELRLQWQGSTFILAAHPKPGVSPAEMRAWVESAVIGSESLHASLKLRRVLGARRTVIERIPDVVVSRGTVLYELTFDDDSVIFGEPLCVENHLRERAESAPAELSLYIKVKV